MCEVFKTLSFVCLFCSNKFFVFNLFLASKSMNLYKMEIFKVNKDKIKNRKAIGNCYIYL